jgi:hypothetical protein
VDTLPIQKQQSGSAWGRYSAWIFWRMGANMLNSKQNGGSGPLDWLCYWNH